jgi:hypothetical protein
VQRFCPLVEASVSIGRDDTPAADDEHERRVRLLLLSKGAVLAPRFGDRSLLSWTTTSGRDAGPGAIATRDCFSWRGIAGAIAYA